MNIFDKYDVTNPYYKFFTVITSTEDITTKKNHIVNDFISNFRDLNIKKGKPRK